MENYQMQEDWNKLISTIAEEKILGIFYWREDRAYVITMPTAASILTYEAREFGIHLGTTIATVIPFTYLWSALQSNEFDVNVNCIFSTPNFLVNPYYSNDFCELCQAWIIEKDIFSRKPYDCEKMLAKMSELLLKSLSVKQCDSHKFKEAITKTEEKALKAILIKIGREGVVSVSELIKETKISRPVFSSLLEKLSKFNCANVQNMGVKGTHLIFSQEILNYYQKEA